MGGISSRRARRALGAGVIAIIMTVAGLASAGPAAAANPVTPGDFTGFGFDQCQAPSQTAMDQWWKDSNFTGVGIYIAGRSRGCRVQTYLSATWVRTQQARGWRLLPVTLGPQASCNPRYPRYGDDPTIDPDPADGYVAARRQAINEANAAVAAAQGYGIAAGSTMFYDLEGFDITNQACRESAMWFISAWSYRIKVLGYRSAMYSSAASGIKAIYDVRRAQPSGFTYPSDLWIADWDGKASTSTTYIPDTVWSDHDRVKQYRGGHDETHGGVTINIDTDYLDIGRGSYAPPVVRCGGVRVDFDYYPDLAPATSTYTPPAAYVKALKCMLSTRGTFDGVMSGYYGSALRAAVHDWQRTHGLTVRDLWTRGAWKTLWAANRHPILKRGSAGDQVRDLQRALNSTTRTEERVKVTGVLDWTTHVGLTSYQRRLGRTVNGFATDVTWYDLAHAR
ncbi:glycoside hydrolase domain-containing protein [Nocardioides sp. NPDC126508]